MAFVKEAVRTPTSIGRIRTILADGNGQPASRQGTAQVEVMDQNGEIMSDKSYDLQKNLTAQQLAQVVAVMDMLRTAAQALL